MCGTDKEKDKNISSGRPYQFASLDFERRERTGFAEVVFCQGKPDGFLQDIFLRLYNENGEVMGTRASLEQ